MNKPVDFEDYIPEDIYDDLDPEIIDAVEEHYLDLMDGDESETFSLIKRSYQ
jgi:hypothetical protein